MIDLISLKIWADDELNSGHRSKASKINKIYEKYFNILSTYSQNQIIYSINKTKVRRYKMKAMSEIITNEFFE